MLRSRGVRTLHRAVRSSSLGLPRMGRIIAGVLAKRAVISLGNIVVFCGSGAG